MVVLGQRPVGKKAVHTAVAGLAQIHYFAVAAALFAGHEVVAAGELHGPLAEAAVDSRRALGAGRGFGGSLGKLLAASHEGGGQIGLTGLLFYLISPKKLRIEQMGAYIDRKLIA
ncbi:hypothetical protein GCM10027422_04510 [Hymenobacter arcticus]